MYVGHAAWCLKVSNLLSAKRFYQGLGLEVFYEGDGTVLLRRGSLQLGLMTFLDDDMLNFRGEDAFAIQAHLQQQGLQPSGQPKRYDREEFDTGFEGACWSTKDPDGHVIFFDTHRGEMSKAAQQGRVEQVLKNTEQDLIDLGASDDCLAAFRQHVLSRFASTDAKTR